jgi:hypothetical protein
MRVLFGLMQNSAAHSMCFLPLVLGDAHSFQRDEAYRAARAGREISDTWSRPPTPLHLDAFFRCHADSVLGCFGSVIHTASTHATHKNRK